MPRSYPCSIPENTPSQVYPSPRRRNLASSPRRIAVTPPRAQILRQRPSRCATSGPAHRAVPSATSPSKAWASPHPATPGILVIQGYRGFSAFLWRPNHEGHIVVRDGLPKASDCVRQAVRRDRRPSAGICARQPWKTMVLGDGYLRRGSHHRPSNEVRDRRVGRQQPKLQSSNFKLDHPPE